MAGAAGVLTDDGEFLVGAAGVLKDDGVVLAGGGAVLAGADFRAGDFLAFEGDGGFSEI